jgi:hypothetical protein
LNLLAILALTAGGLAWPLQSALADNTPRPLPFTQNWSDTGMIVGVDNWSGVPGITGYRGDNLTSAAGTDPQTILAPDDAGVVDVIPNQSSVALTDGGVAEFEIADPVVALQGSNTADAPYLLISLNAAGMESVQVSYRVRDIDTTMDDAVQPVALHYRLGGSGNYANVPAAYLADATVPGAIQSTLVSVTLPADANDQPLLQLRIMTSNASGVDEWVGIDDISVTGTATGDPAPYVSAVSPANNAAGVALDANLSVAFSEPVTAAAGAFSLTCSASGQHPLGLATADNQNFTLDPASDFQPGEQCSAAIENTLITDLSGSAQPMLADYAWSFSTAASVDACNDPFLPIYAIQGSGASAAVTGQVITQGVVVGDYEGPSPALRGYYLQDPAGDGNPATSDGIFIYNGNADSVSLGQLVRVSGVAGENQGQTQITLSEFTLCSASAGVAPTDVSLPFAAPDFPERYEGMLVRLPQTLFVTEHFQLGRFGQVVLSSGSRLPQPTNVVAPGAAALALQAQNDLNRLILDDASNAQNPAPIVFGRGGLPLSAANTLRGGDTVAGLVGVLTYTWSGNAASGNAYRLRSLNALGGGLPDFQPANARPAAAPAVGGTLRVTAMNTLNYFNTFGSACSNGVGGAATACRGADNLTEFNRQWPKTVQAILATGADVLGLMEIENDGYGTNSAIQDLVNHLNAATAPGSYAFINADALTGQVNALGTDAIKVAFIYKPAAVTPVGVTAVLNSTAFVNGGDGAARNRPALAQAFEQNGTAARFVAVVNHLKSKGSACDDPDAGDGQGNCNIVRTNAASLLTAWLATDPTGSGDPDVLILGDLNAYAMEDPITALRSAGYANLIADFGGSLAYSYAFDGQWGYLDHALASPGLAAQVTDAQHYHINADEPSVLDYNTDFKSAGQIVSLYNADQFRVSDHDPLLIGLNLVGTNAAPVAPAIDDVTWLARETHAYPIPAFSDADGDALSYSAALKDGGSWPAWLVFDEGTLTFSGMPLNGDAGVYVIEVTADDGRGGTAATAFNLTVLANPLRLFLPVIAGGMS